MDLYRAKNAIWPIKLHYPILVRVQSIVFSTASLHGDFTCVAPESSPFIFLIRKRKFTLTVIAVRFREIFLVQRGLSGSIWVHVDGIEGVPHGRNAPFNVGLASTWRGQHQEGIGHLIVSIDRVHGLTPSLSLYRTLMARQLPDIENVIAVWQRRNSPSAGRGQ